MTILTANAQKQSDALYLKIGSIINGKVIEITSESNKIQAADGSIFIYSATEAEMFDCYRLHPKAGEKADPELNSLDLLTVTPGPAADRKSITPMR